MNCDILCRMISIEDEKEEIRFSHALQGSRAAVCIHSLLQSNCIPQDELKLTKLSCS